VLTVLFDTIRYVRSRLTVLFIAVLFILLFTLLLPGPLGASLVGLCSCWHVVASLVANATDGVIYGLQEAQLGLGELRLGMVSALGTGEAYSGCVARLLASATDVLHSLGFASAGVKADGIPGRGTRLEVAVASGSRLLGVCCEICGAYHSYMPLAFALSGCAS